MSNIYAAFICAGGAPLRIPPGGAAPSALPPRAGGPPPGGCGRPPPGGAGGPPANAFDSSAFYLTLSRPDFSSLRLFKFKTRSNILLSTYTALLGSVLRDCSIFSLRLFSSILASSYRPSWTRLSTSKHCSIALSLSDFSRYEATVALSPSK